MDEFRKHINEMKDCFQSFNKNNSILSNNWKDEQAERFQQSVLSAMNTTSQNVIQLVEQGEKGIGSILSQMEEMEKELHHLEAKWPSP